MPQISCASSWPSLAAREPDNNMPPSTLVRPIRQHDFAGWLPLWDGYNAFYGREGATALAAGITQVTWERFFDPREPVYALVAESESRLLGLAHYLFHRSTTRIELTCYLQDLFTEQEARGRGAARALIEAVAADARDRGAARYYWNTRESNATARALYDRVARFNGFIRYEYPL